MRKVLALLLFAIVSSASHAISTDKYVSQTLSDKSVRSAERATFNNRRHIALKVEKIIRADGISDSKAIIAILVNMWQESRWNPEAKSGSCVGLFQLHTRWAGRGMTYAQLTNINDHVHKLLSLSSYKKWKKWALANTKNTTCGYMSFRFASDVERCATQHRKPREIVANRWWKVYTS